MPARPREKYFFYILFGTVAAVSLALFWPFLTVIFLGAALAVVLYPIFIWFNNSLNGKAPWLAALITTLIFLIILGLPLFFLGSQVFKEARTVYSSVTEESQPSQYVDHLSTYVENLLPSLAQFDVKGRVGDAVTLLSGSITTLFSSTLQTILSFLLTLLALFYFLKDGLGWRKYLIELSPLDNKHDERIFHMLSRSINGVIKGYILIALIQGVLTGLGLWLFGVPAPALWGALAGLTSLIPSIGTALVSLPAIIYLFIFSSTGAGVGLLVWSAVLVGSVDNILNPIIVGKKVELPPLLILFSVLGGIALLGATGVVLGPLTISLLYTLAAIYREDFQT